MKGRRTGGVVRGQQTGVECAAVRLASMEVVEVSETRQTNGYHPYRRRHRLGQCPQQQRRPMERRELYEPHHQHLYCHYHQYHCHYHRHRQESSAPVLRVCARGAVVKRYDAMVRLNDPMWCEA